MTTKQAKAIKHVIAGDSPHKAMKKAGYSPNTYKDPKKLTKSPAFAEVLEKAGISDEQLAKVLKDGLGATKAIVMGIKSEESFVDVVPDHPTRHKFLETGLRLKGHDKEIPPTTVIIPIYAGLSSKPDLVQVPGHSRYPQDFRPQETD
jgi:hypothetical protein